jgi:2-dehydropantoate 2-reductase
MLSNLLGNATSAILNMTPGELFNDSNAYKIEVLELREAVSVMHKLKINVINLPGVPMKWLVRIMLNLPRFLSRFILGKVMSSGRGN